MKKISAKFSAFAAVAAASVLVLHATPVLAASVSPTSYAMPNGDGQAHGGSYNYWDRSYTGSGSTTTDGAALSGGLGKLTDGFISSTPWYLVSNAAGTGEYVGWYAGYTLNPVITFNFAGAPVIDTITIQLDNTYVGGVYAPAAILIDGLSLAFTPPASGSVGSVSFTGLGLLGNSHTIEFDQAFGGWTFVSEISFDGHSSAPEPASLALLGLGLTGLACARRRRS
jgi:hypothetical protein